VGKEYWPKLRRLIKKRQEAIDEANAEAAATKKAAARKKKKANR
jgi:hypothetical protein